MKTAKVFVFILVVASVGGLALRRGAAQREIEAAVVRLGGNVQYDCDVPVSIRHGTIRNRLGLLIGPQFVGSICGVQVFSCRDGTALAGMLERLRALDSLDDLMLDGTAIDHGCIERISELESLSWLSIGGADISDFSPLRNLCCLKSLALSSSKRITRDALRALAEIPLLEELDLSFTDIDGGSLGEFRNFKRLRCLSLVCTEVRGEDLVALESAPNLEHVTVGPTIDGGGESELERIQKMMPRIRLRLE